MVQSISFWLSVPEGRRWRDTFSKACQLADYFDLESKEMRPAMVRLYRKCDQPISKPPPNTDGGGYARDPFTWHEFWRSVVWANRRGRAHRSSLLAPISPQPHHNNINPETANNLLVMDWVSDDFETKWEMPGIAE